MFNCWDEAPSARPTFTEISSRFMEMLEISNLDYNYIDVIKRIGIEVLDPGEVTV